MEALQIRQKLHEYIDTVDEKKLEAIYLILEEGIRDNYQYTVEEIAVFYERRNSHLKDEGKHLTIEESLKQIRERK